MPKSFTADEVRNHNTDKSLWLIVDKQVYDVTNYLKDHPGGGSILKTNGGQDCSKEFYSAHKPTQPMVKKALKKLLIGEVVENSTEEAPKKKASSVSAKKKSDSKSPKKEDSSKAAELEEQKRKAEEEAEEKARLEAQRLEQAKEEEERAAKKCVEEEAAEKKRLQQLEEEKRADEQEQKKRAERKKEADAAAELMRKLRQEQEMKVFRLQNRPAPGFFAKLLGGCCVSDGTNEHDGVAAEATKFN